MKKFMPLSIILLVLIFGSIAIFNNNQQEKTQKNAVELNVSAAASMKDVLLEIKTSYEKANPNVKIVYNFGASGNLRNQIEQGAPADIFISAAVNHMNELEKKDYIKKDFRKDLVENELVLIKNKNSNIKASDFNIITDSSVKKIAMGEPNVVPAGQYAYQICGNLKLWNEVKDKVVFGNNVRNVLAYVETENVDLGMVYKTDAFISDKVDIVAVAPAGSHEKILYPIAIINNPNVKKESKDFYDYLGSDASKEIFRKYGFVIPGEV